MNSNLIHNILNVAIALTSGATAAMLATGCTVVPQAAAIASDAAVVMECSRSWLAPETAAMIVTGLAVAKTVINVVRDGVAGLVKPQPPVG